MTILADALELSRRKLEFSFDPQVYVIRRNLMFAASVVISLTFIKAPKGGDFEVNIGIIKGVLENPSYVYFFASIVCLYYLVWFYIHCKGLVVSNYSSIKNDFLTRLVTLRASEAYQAKLLTIPEKLPPSIQFHPKGGGGAKYFCESTIATNLEDKVRYSKGIALLKNSEVFSFNESNHVVKVTYLYNATDEDFTYLQKHLDMYWRAKKSSAFVTILPIAYSLMSLLLMCFHIYEMFFVAIEPQ